MKRRELRTIARRLRKSGMSFRAVDKFLFGKGNGTRTYRLCK